MNNISQPKNALGYVFQDTTLTTCEHVLRNFNENSQFLTYDRHKRIWKGHYQYL